jgi:protein-tyrosine phosphatase
MSKGPVPDSYWLIEGTLLAGEYPGSPYDLVARENLSKFLDAGILTFINLTETREPLTSYEDLLDELAAERGLVTKHLRFPICDGSVPVDREVMRQVLSTIRTEIAAGRPVYVHCWGGIGRTGTVVGCWLVEEGLAGSDAIERIGELRRHTPDRYLQSPETEEQCQFILEWDQDARGQADG